MQRCTYSVTLKCLYVFRAKGLRRWRKHHQRQNMMAWKEIHDLEATAQAMSPPQASLSSILLAVFVILHSNSATAQRLPSPPNTHNWILFAEERKDIHDLVAGAQAMCSQYPQLDSFC